MLKMKLTKVIKGIIFIAIGILMFTVKFYAISYANADGTGFLDIIRFYSLEENWFELFKPTIINLILGGLFIALGLLEFKEAITHGN